MTGHDRNESRNEMMLLRRGGRSGRNWRNDLGLVSGGVGRREVLRKTRREERRKE